MRLTPAELARKLASRQSTNMMVARAQLLEKSRRSGSQGLSLPPDLAARLQAARQQVSKRLYHSCQDLVAIASKGVLVFDLLLYYYILGFQ